MKKPAARDFWLCLALLGLGFATGCFKGPRDHINPYDPSAADSSQSYSTYYNNFYSYYSAYTYTTWYSRNFPNLVAGAYASGYNLTPINLTPGTDYYCVKLDLNQVYLPSKVLSAFVDLYFSSGSINSMEVDLNGSPFVPPAASLPPQALMGTYALNKTNPVYYSFVGSSCYKTSLPLTAMFEYWIKSKYPNNGFTLRPLGGVADTLTLIEVRLSYHPAE